MNEQEYMAVLNDIEEQIRSKLENEIERNENSLSCQEFEKRKEDIIEFYISLAKADVEKAAIKVMEAENTKLLDEYGINQAEIVEFEHNLSNDVKDYLEYLSNIQKPLEKSLAQHSSKIKKSLNSRIESSIEALKVLIEDIKVIPGKINEMKALATQTIANDEKEIENLNAKFHDLVSQEEGSQEKINSVEVLIENEHKVIHDTKLAIDDLKEKEKVCEQLNKDMEIMYIELEKHDQNLNEIRIKCNSQLQINSNFTERMNETQNKFDLVLQETDQLKKSITMIDKNIKSIKSKAGTKLTFAEIEADENYKDLIDSTIFQELKQKIVNLQNDTTHINEDLKNVQENNAAQDADLNEIKVFLEKLVENYKEVEKSMAQAEIEEKEKSHKVEEIKAQIENDTKEDNETIENLKNMLEKKYAHKNDLENISKKLVYIKKLLEEESKRKKKQEQDEKEQNKGKNARRSKNQRKSLTRERSATDTFTIEEKSSINPSTSTANLKTPSEDLHGSDSFSEFEGRVYRPPYMMNQKQFNFPELKLVVEGNNEDDDNGSNYDTESYTVDASMFDTDDDI